MARRALRETNGELIVLAHSMGTRVVMEMGCQSPDEGPAHDEAANRENRIAEAKADVVACARRWATNVTSAKSARDACLVSDIRQMVDDCPTEVHEW